ncbi:MAG: rod shape-determining protein RodA [Treponema porcinum]|uniref:rod shape-determining protein RodA n=2 Tax=Treponema porcinum TaxID=261392 RepID=UPI002A81C891|nr:rod shape-determining protein RodA [Treponema porcinum]MDY5047790.1 rod shape-determining protein RodA [Treponema porcinum]
MKKNILESFDLIILLCVLVLVSTGIAFIYSSGVNSDGILVTNEYVKQIVWAGIGMVFLAFFALTDYRKCERISGWLFVVLLLVLVYTRLFGRYVNGAKSWLGIGDFGVQPSEFGKIIFILFLAKYLNGSANENPLKRLIISAVIFAVPTLLILAQPDLGTATVYIPIFFFMCFMAEIPLTYLMFLFGICASTVFFTILPVWNEYIAHNSVVLITTLSDFKLKMILILAAAAICAISIVVRYYFHGRKYYFWIAYFSAIIFIGLICSSGAGKVLKDYQIRRLIVFMDPSVDPLGSGWNIIQSKIAIGAGGAFGRSFLHGTQSHYRFLPQQSTDFIFSILSEEMGFAGGAVVFVLYMIIMWRTIVIIKNTSNKFGMYIASGILGMFVIHFFINVGMVMGIMPITGIPLLFLSYGGSSLLTAMSCIGLLMSINSRKFDFT